MHKKYCNMCGKEFDEWDWIADNSIHKKIGYGSKYDFSEIHIDLCVDCMDKLIEQCKINPIDGEYGINGRHSDADDSIIKLC